MARRVTPSGVEEPSRCRRRPVIAVILLASFAATALHPAAAWGRHLARTDPTEPIFTQRSFVEKDIELTSTWVRAPGSNTVELAPGVTWVFAKRLELGLELPVDVRIPDHGSTVSGLGDMDLGAQVLLCCQPDGPLDYFSIRADVAPPTGSLKKDLGGTGSWSVSLLPARRFTILRQLPDLLVHMQLSYTEDIRASPALDDRSVRQKQFLWNTAFVQQYLGGRIRPVFELLGTTVADAAKPADERTVVELAAGTFLDPFPDDSPLSPAAIGIGWKWPVHGRLDGTLTGVLILEWSFGT